MRPHDHVAGGGAGGGGAGGGGGGGEDDEVNLDWQAGETLMMAIEAVDETGCVDDDFDAVVLLETDVPSVQGRGLVRVTRGKGYVPLLTNASGEVVVTLQDGGFTA